MNASDAATVAAWAAAASAFVAVVSALVAMIGIRAESTVARRSLGVDILSRYEERFDAAPMRAARRGCAQFLLDCWGRHPVGQPAVIAPVLDFFEPIGVLTRQKVLDPEAVNVYFGDWILVYWRVCKPYVVLSRGKRPTVWEGAEYLYACVLRVQSFQVRKTKRSHQSAFLWAQERLPWRSLEASGLAEAERDDEACKDMLRAEATQS